MRDLIIGVDLGGTKIYTAAADIKGNILAEEKVPTRAEEGRERVLAGIIESVERVRKGAGAGRLLALGVGAPGPLDPVTGVVYQAPNLGWREVPLKDLLRKVLGVPVWVENDANLAALGEFVHGAGQGVRDMVYITVSTGVGGGLILNGGIYRGSTGAAGEIGHMVVQADGPPCRCGGRGCLETLASGTAMAERAMRMVEGGAGRTILEMAGGRKEDITAEIVARAAAAGDPEALEILAGAGRALGIGIASVVNLLNPPLVVMGGGAMQAGEPLWNSMLEQVHRLALGAARRDLRIVPARLGGRAGVIGALVLARRSILGESV